MFASMNPWTVIRGDEKVRLRPDHQHGEDEEDGEDEDGECEVDQDDGDDESEGMGHPPVRLLLNAWLVP